MNEELNQAVQALTDEDMAELAGGRLSSRAIKVAKYAGIAAAGAAGALGAAAGVAAIAGAAKYGDGAHYFKEWFGKKPEPTPGPTGRAWADLKGERGEPAYDAKGWKGDELKKLFKED